MVTSKAVQEAQVRVLLTDALLAVSEGSLDHAQLESALEAHLEIWDDDELGSFMWGLRETLRALVFAVKWKDAVRSAEPDADRFATAARVRGAEVIERCSDSTPAAISDAAKALSELSRADDVARAARALYAVAVPPRLSGLFSWARPVAPDGGVSPSLPDQPPVALLIRHNDEAVMRPTILQPGAMHQLTVEARVDGWPEDAEALEISFVSVHPRDFLYASDVAFQPGDSAQPLEIRVAGERPPNDPRLALTARARFRRGASYVSARLVGNTTLEIMTYEPDGGSLAGLPTAALRVSEMMGELGNAVPQLPVADRRDVRLLIEGVLRFAHTALDDRIGVLSSERVDELLFQQELRHFLQADPGIGARLVEAQGRAGGTTDLGLGRIVLELKVEKGNPLTLQEACERFGGQAVQYASAGDAQVSLLAVLEATAKRAPAGVMGNEVGWFYPETVAGSEPAFPSMLGVLVVRSGFPVPSSFSR